MRWKEGENEIVEQKDLRFQESERWVMKVIVYGGDEPLRMGQSLVHEAALKGDIVFDSQNS